MRYESTGWRRWIVLLLLLLHVTGTSLLLGHEGEDHGEAAPAPTSTPGTAENQLVTEGATDFFELLLKYPVPETGEDTRVRMLLADYATNRPIDSARFTLSFSPEGVEVRQEPMAISPGVYEMVVVFPDDIVYTLVATVSAERRTDFVEVRNIYAGASAERFLAEHAAGAESEQLEEEGTAWWIVALAILGLVAIGAIAIAAMRRVKRSRHPAVNVARDPELAQQGDIESETDDAPLNRPVHGRISDRHEDESETASGRSRDA